MRLSLGVELNRTRAGHDARIFLRRRWGMEKFSSFRACPKCGQNDRVKFEYHQEARLLVGVENCAEEEHMHRVCEWCGYQWSEEPLNLP